MQEEVNIENVIAGTIYKFEEIDSADIVLIMAYLSKLNIRIANHTLVSINRLIYDDHGTIKIKKTLDKTIAKERLKKIAGKTITFIEQIDLNMMVLNKIKMFGKIIKEYVKEHFNKLELNVLFKLLEQGYIEFQWNDNALSNAHEVLVLTNKGNVKIYIEKHKNEISKFINMLKAKNYNVSLFYPFMQSINNLDDYHLNDSTILEFEHFCQSYNLSPKI